MGKIATSVSSFVCLRRVGVTRGASMPGFGALGLTIAYFSLAALVLGVAIATRMAEGRRIRRDAIVLRLNGERLAAAARRRQAFAERRVREAVERERMREKIAALTKAFDEFRFAEIIGDPEMEKIPELRYLAGLVCEHGLGGGLPDLRRAEYLYGGATGVCDLAETRLAQLRISGDWLDKDASAATTNRIVACLPGIEARAERGEAMAAKLLYDLCESGLGVRKDRQAGRRWLERAASGGNFLAKLELACESYYGDVVYPTDRERAASLMREIEPSGCWMLHYARGRFLAFDGRMDLAERDFLACLPAVRSLAHQGSAEAQAALADMYAGGCGVPKDSREAVRWYRLAAARGHAGAQAGLAVALSTGEGVDRDVQEAVRWAQKSAEQGSSQGQDALGYFYLNGIGVEKDAARAFHWFKLGAANGNLEAMEFLGDCYGGGTGVEPDSREAIRWYRAAALRGCVGAQNKLGFMCETGLGCDRDLGAAAAWYRQAAERGLAAAQYNLALSCQEGSGVEQDLGEAVRWMRAAAEQGFADAENRLGVMHLEGIGTGKDPAAARRWFVRALKHGSSDAPYNLGVIYQEGRLGKVDLRLARRLYLLADRRGCPDAAKRLAGLENPVR